MSKYAGANSASQLPSTIVTVRKYGFAVLINSLYTTHCADFTDEEGYTRALYSSTLLSTLHLIILRGQVKPVMIEHRRLHEESAAQAPPHIPLPLQRRQQRVLNQRQSQPVHNATQLLSHTHSAVQTATIQPVFRAPQNPILLSHSLERLEATPQRNESKAHAHQRDMVGFRIREILPVFVPAASRQLLLLLPERPHSRGFAQPAPPPDSPAEDAGHRQHRHNREDLGQAEELWRDEQALGELRFQREVRQGLAQFRDRAVAVQRAQEEERLQRAHERLRGRRRQKVELGEVLHAEAFQREHDGGDVAAQDLGHCLLLRLTPRGCTHRQLRVEGLLRVQAEALARPRSTGTTGALLGGGLRHGRDDERLDARLGVEHLLLAEAAVHHVHHAVDRHRRLGDVRRHHHLATARRRRLERLRLLRGRQRRVQRHCQEWGLSRGKGSGFAAQRGAGIENLLFAGEEEKNVACRLVEVDLNRGFDGGRHVVTLGFRRVEDLDREEAAGHAEERRVVEVLLEVKEEKETNLEGRGVERGAHDDQLEVGAVEEDLLDHAQNDVGVERALVHLIQDDDIVLLEEGIGDGLAQEHAVGDVLQHRPVARLLLESDGIADLRSALHIHFLGDTPCDARCGNTPRLCASDVGSMVQIGVQQVEKQCLRLRERKQNIPGVSGSSFHYPSRPQR